MGAEASGWDVLNTALESVYGIFSDAQLTARDKIALARDQLAKAQAQVDPTGQFLMVAGIGVAALVVGAMVFGRRRA
jgi:hypothetical protein